MWNFWSMEFHWMLICNIKNIKWSWKLEQLWSYNKKAGWLSFLIKPQQISNSSSSKVVEVLKKSAASFNIHLGSRIVGNHKTRKLFSKSIRKNKSFFCRRWDRENWTLEIHATESWLMSCLGWSGFLSYSTQTHELDMLICKEVTSTTHTATLATYSLCQYNAHRNTLKNSAYSMITKALQEANFKCSSYTQKYMLSL